MRKLTVALSLVFCMSGATLAHATDLVHIFDQARQSDPQFMAAEAVRQAALEAKPLARSLLLPSASLSGSYTHDRSDISKINPRFGGPQTLTFTNKVYSLNLNQVLYNRSYFIRLRQADAQVAQAESQFQSARQALILRVAQRYFAVLAAQDDLDFARAEKIAIAHQLNQAQQRFKVGLTAITDVRESKASYDLSVAQEIAARNQLAVSQESLRELTGQPYPVLATLTERMPLITPQPDNMKDWVRKALSDNFTLLSATRAMDVARDNVERTRSGRYPTLNLVAAHSYSDTGGLFSRTQTDNTVGLQLNVPLYQGGSITARVRQATYLYQQAQDNMERTRRATERETRSAFLNVLSGISEVKARQQALKSSETALEATETGYKVGTRTAVDVLNAQQNLYGAKRDYAQARYAYILNTLSLKQASGSLNETDLNMINIWLK